MATAIGAVAVGIDAIVPVDAGSIVVEVTACAVRLVGGRRPLYDLRVGLVATCAGEIAGMVQWLVGESDMSRDVRYPCDRVMANTALLGRHEMTRILPGCGIAVVTGRAGSEDLVMIHGSGGCPDRRAVAVLTYVGREYVTRVLARSVRAVVAAAAVTRDIRVIEIGRRPCDGRVAVIAVIAAGDVSGVLARCDRPVVAAGAGADDLGVIDHVRRRKDIHRFELIT